MPVDEETILSSKLALKISTKQLSKTHYDDLKLKPPKDRVLPKILNKKYEKKQVMKKDVFTVNIYRNGRGNWKQAESRLKMNWTKEDENSESEKMIVKRKSLPGKWTKFFGTFVTQKTLSIQVPSLQLSIKKLTN